MTESNEQRYFDALKRITLYQSVERLRRHSERDWGVEYPESLEMAYENVISDAERAIRGKRRPKAKPPQTAPASPAPNAGGKGIAGRNSAESFAGCGGAN